MNEEQFDKLMEQMIDFTAENLANTSDEDEVETPEEREEREAKERASIKDTLEKMSNMLRSKAFERKCKEQAKHYGVRESVIKNAYAVNILNCIANTTGVVLEVIGEAFNYLVRLVSYVLQKVMDFAISALTALVNIITFRKEVSA